MSINSVFLSGNLTRDPELRYTSSRIPVLNIGIAVNDRRKNSQTGEWEDYPNFFDCKLFGAFAETIHPMLYKGCKVCLSGKLEYSSWEKDGQRRSKIDVVIDQIEVMRKKEQQIYEEDYYDEDVPF